MINKSCISPNVLFFFSYVSHVDWQGDHQIQFLIRYPIENRGQVCLQLAQQFQMRTFLCKLTNYFWQQMANDEKSSFDLSFKLVSDDNWNVRPFGKSITFRLWVGITKYARNIDKIWHFIKFQNKSFNYLILIFSLLLFSITVQMQNNFY